MFENLLLNGILILFPYLTYIFFISTNFNLNKKEKNLSQILTIIISFLLLMRFGENENMIILLFNIPIFFSLISSHYITACFLSFIVSLNCDINILNFSILFANYLILIILNLKIDNKKIYILLFALVNSLSFSLILKYSNVLSIIFCFVLSLLILYLIYKKALSLVEFNINYNKLMQEKEIRLSLFKITHEIKNPIAVCKAYLDMYDSNDINKSKKYISIISNEIERVLCLLEDFMLVNGSNVKCDIMDITMLLEENIKKTNELACENNIKFNYEIPDDEIYIMGDYNRLNQVFINLLKNSVEADSKNINVNCTIENKNVIVNIKDDGIGINKDILTKIKEPFYTTKLKGTGLGVSLSNEIIEAHHGQLKYSSEYGKGTSVKVVLPLYEI